MPQEVAGWFQGTIDVVRKFIWVLKFVSMETHYLLSRCADGTIVARKIGSSKGEGSLRCTSRMHKKGIICRKDGVGYYCNFCLYFFGLYCCYLGDGNSAHPHFCLFRC